MNSVRSPHMYRYSGTSTTSSHTSVESKQRCDKVDGGIGRRKSQSPVSFHPEHTEEIGVGVSKLGLMYAGIVQTLFQEQNSTLDHFDWDTHSVPFASRCWRCRD